MLKPLSITVNGKRRRVLALATPKPIAELRMISLKGAGSSKTGLAAFPADYRNGAYRMQRAVLFGLPGTYRPRAVEIQYTDGTTAISELSDEIVIEVPEVDRAEPGPAFKVL